MKRLAGLLTLIAMTVAVLPSSAKITPPPGSKIFTLAPTEDVIHFHVDGNSTCREQSYFNVPELVGKTIYGIEVYGLLQNGKSYEDMNLIYNQAIYIIPGTNHKGTRSKWAYANVREDGVMYATFNDGYVVPDSGFYAGWWWDTNELDSGVDSLFVASAGGQGTPGGMWAENWPTAMKDLSAIYGPAPIRIYYGDAGAKMTAEMSVPQVSDIEVAVNQKSTVAVTLINDSWAAVKNFTYSVVLDGKQVGTSTVKLAASSSASPMITSGQSKKIKLNLPGLAEGTHTITVTVTKVNDITNTSAKKAMTFNVKAIDGKVQIPEGCIGASMVGGDRTSNLGVGLDEIEVATRFASPIFKGLKVVGAEIRGLRETGLTGFTLWSRPTLDDKNTQEVVALQSGDCAGGLFKNPIEITENGPFFGCSFEVTGDNQYSIPVGGKTNVTDGCWAKDPYGWVDLSKYGTLMMTLFVQAEDLPEGALTLGNNFGNNVFVAGKEYKAQFNVVNLGKNPITNVGFAYDTPELKIDGTATVDGSVPALYGADQTMTLVMPALDKTGHVAGKLSLPIVNGVNNTKEATANIDFRFISRAGTKRPIFEEYTGVGCGWCPRGVVAMGVMAKKYPDFIPAVYHLYFTDAMTPTGVKLPWNSDGAPDANIDRTGNLDPFYGTGDQDMGIEKDYLAACEQLPPADLELKAEWDDSTSVVSVHTLTDFSFVEENMTYRLGYILIANELEGEGDGWKQSNYFLGKEEYADNPYLSVLYDGSYDLSIFHDVVLTGSKPQGVMGSLPKSIKENYSYGDTISFYMGDNTLISGPEDMSVIVVLLDKKGKVRNARKVQVGESTTDRTFPEPGAPESAIKEIGAEIPSETIYYDMMGRRVENPQRGIFIKVQNNRATKVKL